MQPKKIREPRQTSGRAASAWWSGSDAVASRASNLALEVWTGR